MFITAQTGSYLGTQELFWVYYPDMRPIFSKYDVYNGKNYGARMSWEDLFESRMFYGRIIKSTIDNPYDKFIDQYPGLKIKEYFNYWRVRILKRRYLITNRIFGHTKMPLT